MEPCSPGTTSASRCGRAGRTASPIGLIHRGGVGRAFASGGTTSGARTSTTDGSFFFGSHRQTGGHLSHGSHLPFGVSPHLRLAKQCSGLTPATARNFTAGLSSSTARNFVTGFIGSGGSRISLGVLLRCYGSQTTSRVASQQRLAGGPSGAITSEARRAVSGDTFVWAREADLRVTLHARLAQS